MVNFEKDQASVSGFNPIAPMAQDTNEAQVVFEY